MEDAPRRRRPPRAALVSAAAAAASAVLILHRTARDPIQPYGDLGAAHLEHVVRLRVLQNWRTGPEGLLDRVASFDQEFPPLLHLLTLPAGALFGHHVEGILWTGVLWLFALAGIVSWTVRLLGGSPTASAAAFTATVLWPAGQAFATRYYYDLPMTVLLWCLVPVALATWDRKPLAGGAAVGGLITAACLIKWSALALGPLLAIAVAFCPAASASTSGEARSIHPRRRALALAVAGLVSAAGTFAFAALFGADSSLAVMLDDMWPGLGDASYSDRFPDPSAALAWVSEHGDRVGRSSFAADLPFYPATLVTAHLSLPLALVLGACLLAWLVFDRRGWVVVVLAVALQWFFLARALRVLDERFLITVVPALLVAGALGWSSIQGSRRTGVAVIGIALALLVGADVHYGIPSFSPHVDLGLGTSIPVTARGLSIQDSFEQRGWARKDSATPPRMAARVAINEAVARCPGTRVLMADAPREASPFGERYWLEYRLLLQELEYGHPRRYSLDGCTDDRSVDIAVSASEAVPEPPGCFGDGWRVDRIVPLPRFPWDAAVWVREGVTCR